MSKFDNKARPVQETDQQPASAADHELRVVSMKMTTGVHMDLKISAMQRGKSLQEVAAEAFAMYLKKYPVSR